MASKTYYFKGLKLAFKNLMLKMIMYQPDKVTSVTRAT